MEASEDGDTRTFTRRIGGDKPDVSPQENSLMEGGYWAFAVSLYVEHGPDTVYMQYLRKKWNYVCKAKYSKKGIAESWQMPGAKRQKFRGGSQGANTDLNLSRGLGWLKTWNSVDTIVMCQVFSYFHGHLITVYQEGGGGRRRPVNFAWLNLPNISTE